MLTVSLVGGCEAKKDSHNADTSNPGISDPSSGPAGLFALETNGSETGDVTLEQRKINERNNENEQLTTGDIS